MAKADVVLQARPPQIEVAVLEPHVLRHRVVFRDLKWRRLRFVQHANLAREHFHFAGGELRIDRVFRSPLHRARHPDDELGAQPLRHGHQRVVLADDDLRDARAVADVDEGDAAQIANAVHPSEEHDVGADVARAQRTTCVSSSQTT